MTPPLHIATGAGSESSTPLSTTRKLGGGAYHGIALCLSKPGCGHLSNHIETIPPPPASLNMISHGWQYTEMITTRQAMVTYVNHTSQVNDDPFTPLVTQLACRRKANGQCRSSPRAEKMFPQLANGCLISLTMITLHLPTKPWMISIQAPPLSRRPSGFE